jgi:competence protein ComEC
MRLVFIVLGWTVGILLTSGGVFALDWWAWLLVVLAICGTVALSWSDPLYRWINIALLALALGALRASFVPQTSSVALLNDTGGITLEGSIVGDPDYRDDRVMMIVDVERALRGGFIYDVGGRVLVQLPRHVEVHPGDYVTVTGSIHTPAMFDTFSYQDYLARQGVFSILDEASLRERQEGQGFWRWLSDARHRLLDAMGRMLPEPQAGLLAGILLGNERGISPALADDFSRTGASHIIAISGFNMAIIAGVVDKLLRRSAGQGRWQVLVTLGVIALYTLFTGANPAVIRAALMSSLVIVGRSLRRQAFVPASLAFSVLVMSAHDPNVLYSVSFQLSFFAVVGMALFTEPLKHLFDSVVYSRLPPLLARRASDLLVESIIVTLAATLTTLPVILLVFGRMSLVFLPVNLLIIPVQSAILLIGGLATLLVLIVPPVAQALYWLAYAYLWWTIGVVRSFADLSWAEASVSVSAGLIYLYLMGVIGWIVMQGTRPVWWESLKRFVQTQVVISATLAGGTSLLVLLLLIGIDRPDGRLHVWFLDVGHSNAILIETPGGAQVLVDGGRYPSRLLSAIGDNIPLNDTQIELVVISHPDPNDFGAIPAVLKRYDAGAVMVNGQPNLSEAYLQLLDEAARFSVVEARSGHVIEFDDGVMLEVLFPIHSPTLSDSINSGPLVLRLRYGEVSFLLPSNLNSDAQQAFLKAGFWPEATVIQLPDHGSARSLDSGFIRAVQPSLAVIQADRANRRGDPDADILAMLPEHTQILRTDQGGTIHLWTDGQRLWSAQDG